MVRVQCTVSSYVRLASYSWKGETHREAEPCGLSTHAQKKKSRVNLSVVVLIANMDRRTTKRLTSDNLGDIS